MKQTALKYIVESQKAIAAFVGSAGAVASIGFVPEPYAGWLAAAIVVATGIATYALPYVEHVIETGSVSTKDTPLDGLDAMSLVDDYWKTAKDEIEHGTVRHAADITAEIPKVVEPSTVETPAVTAVVPAAALPAAEGPETTAMPLDELRAELTAPDQHDPAALPIAA